MSGINVSIYTLLALRQPLSYGTYLTGATESKQIKRLQALLGVFFPARRNQHLHLKNRAVFRRTRPFFSVTNCPDYLIPVRSLQQHMHTYT